MVSKEPGVCSYVEMKHPPTKVDGVQEADRIGLNRAFAPIVIGQSSIFNPLASCLGSAALELFPK